MSEEKVVSPKVKYRVIRVEEAPDNINPLRPTPAMRILLYINGLGYRFIYIPKDEMSEEAIKKKVKEEYETKWKYEMMTGEV